MMVFLASGGGLLSFNTGFAIWVLISMIIFIWAMGKYAVPHIVKALDDREMRIKESLESAEKALAKAQKISQENDKALREAEIRAQQIRKEAIEEAERLRADRMDKAKKDAVKVLEDAKRSIEQEKQRAMIELRNEVAELAVKAASIIIETELDKDKNKKIVENFITNLSSN